MKNVNRWFYAILGVVVLLMSGLVYAWSMMKEPIRESRKWTGAELELTFTLVMAFFCIGCLIGGVFSKKIQPRIYLFLSGILFLAGFMIAGMTGDSPVLLYLGFGVLGGLGAGFSYNAVMSTVSQWFPDKQGMVSGILLMGFGISSFIIGKVYTAVTPSDGTDAWQNTFRIMGIIIVIVMVVCGIFFKRPEPGYQPAGMNTGAVKKVREPAMEATTGQMVKMPSFWMYYIWAVLISAAGLVLVSQASGIAKQVGPLVPNGDIATVVGLISIFNGIGRVIFGTMFDKKGYRLTMIVDMIIFIVAELILMLALNSGSFVCIVIGFVVGGFAYGCVTPTNSALISDFFGRKNYPLNFSLINTNLLIASFASTIAGKLCDSSQSYMSAIFMMIGVTAACFVVFFGIRRPNSRKVK